MNIARLALPLVLPALFAMGCSSVDASSQASQAALEDSALSSFTWPTPEDWARDSIPFPLSYAPELPYQSGTDEVMFMPSFFDPNAPTYWSYNYAWVVDSLWGISGPQMSAELTTYYAGLARAVDPENFDASAHHADIRLVGQGKFRGELSTVDSFGDGRALHMAVIGESFTCGAYRVILASVSPRPESDAEIWGALEAQRKTFQCVEPRRG